MWTEENSVDQLIKGVMQFGPDILENCISSDDLSQYIQRLDSEHLNYPIPKQCIDSTHWYIPSDYQTMDIEDFLIQQCPNNNLDRLNQELLLFKNHNMIPILKTMKFIVDTLRANNIVWGVGRGSSVASYALYLMGVHRVDSVKYNLPINEFFKGEYNE
jgi:DNA polymerase III alpha subunit